MASKQSRTPRAVMSARLEATSGAGAREAERPAMADRRSRIIAIATRKFAEFGFEATTVRQIADDVNILSGSLYHHFATKDDILHEVVRDVVVQMRDSTLRIASA